jgi:hypothetical protein
MMSSKFKLIMYYDINYTSPFLVKIGSTCNVFSPYGENALQWLVEQPQTHYTLHM